MELVQELYSKSAKKILQESMAISEKNPKISIMDRHLKNKKFFDDKDNEYKKWQMHLKNSQKEKFLDDNSREEEQNLDAKSREQNTIKEAAIKNEVSNNKRKLAKAELKKCPYEENQTKLLTQNSISIKHGQTQFSPIELDKETINEEDSLILKYLNDQNTQESLEAIEIKNNSSPEEIKGQSNSKNQIIEESENCNNERNVNIDISDIDKSDQTMKDTKMYKSNISKSFQKSFLSFCDEVSTSKESNNENQSGQIFNDADIEPKEDDNSIGGQPDSKVRKLEKIEKFNSADTDKEKTGSLDSANSSNMAKDTKKCEFCNEMVPENAKGFAMHQVSCKVFVKHMKKVPNGLGCKACTFKSEFSSKGKARSTLVYHLKNKHKIGLEPSKTNRKCEGCGEMISVRTVSSYNQHYKACKIYSSFMRKSSNGYECNLCSCKIKGLYARRNITAHIKKKHPNRNISTENAFSDSKTISVNESRHSELNPEENTNISSSNSTFPEVDSPNINNSEKSQESIHCDQIITDHSMRVEETCQISRQNVMENDNETTSVIGAQRQIISDLNPEENTNISSSNSTFPEVDSPNINNSEKSQESIRCDQIITDHSMKVEETCQISLQDVTENDNETTSISEAQRQIISDQDASIDNSVEHTEEEDISEQDLIENDNETNTILEKVQRQTQQEKATEKSGSKKQCYSCQELFSCKSLDPHFDSCKVYFPHMKKLNSPDKGYECKVCKFIVRRNSGKLTTRSKMYAHLKGKHKIDKDSIQSATIDNLIEHREKEDMPDQDLIENDNESNDISNNIKLQFDSMNCTSTESILQGKSINGFQSECKSCKEIIACRNDRQVVMHYDSCKVYFQHMKKSSVGYECKACSYKTKHGGGKKARPLMYMHLKNKHKISKNSKKSGAKSEVEHTTRKKYDKCVKSNESKDNPDSDANLGLITCSLNNFKPTIFQQNIDVPENSLLDTSTDQNIINDQFNPQLNSKEENCMNQSNSSTECTLCKEMLDKSNWNKHTELCQEASKYMNGQSCLICEIEFDSITEVAKHIKNKHLDIIFVLERQSEVSQTNIKEVIDLVEENDSVSPLIESNISRPETVKVKPEMKEEIIYLDNLNEQTETGLEPRELTAIHICPMCFRKYASLSDLESHISLFHRIPKKIQRQSMQGGQSMSIITQTLL